MKRKVLIPVYEASGRVEKREMMVEFDSHGEGWLTPDQTDALEEARRYAASRIEVSVQGNELAMPVAETPSLWILNSPMVTGG